MRVEGVPVTEHGIRWWRLAGIPGSEAALVGVTHVGVVVVDPLAGPRPLEAGIGQDGLDVGLEDGQVLGAGVVPGEGFGDGRRRHGALVRHEAGGCQGLSMIPGRSNTTNGDQIRIDRPAVCRRLAGPRRARVRSGGMFLDQVKIHVRAGDGGDGAATFRREAHVPRGGPDGGDGGRGGSIHLQVDPGETTLIDFRFKHHFSAPSGGRGTGARRHGKAGRDVVLRVPPGTAVFDEGRLVADLVARDQRVMVARGGRGGLGNVHFATATHRAPRHALKGEPGEERWLSLELRLIADVGLVGLPNAGKSTLLRALTEARPKVADYPFTTLEPNLGVLDLGADGDDERRPTIADLPGLIEGASMGAGLGHAFLRHVERTRLIAHVVDAAARDPVADLETVREELAAHDAALLDKPTLIVANKTDLSEADDGVAALRRWAGTAGLPEVAVSGLTGAGIGEFRRAIAGLLPGPEELATPPEPAGVVVHRFDSLDRGFAVSREPDGFRVRGRRVERLAAQTDFSNDESVERFRRELARLGIERALRGAGVAEGDPVVIGAAELEWRDAAWTPR